MYVGSYSLGHNIKIDRRLSVLTEIHSLCLRTIREVDRILIIELDRAGVVVDGLLVVALGELLIAQVL